MDILGQILHIVLTENVRGPIHVGPRKNFKKNGPPELLPPNVLP